MNFNFWGRREQQRGQDGHVARNTHQLHKIPNSEPPLQPRLIKCLLRVWCFYCIETSDLNSCLSIWFLHWGVPDISTPTMEGWVSPATFPRLPCFARLGEWHHCPGETKPRRPPSSSLFSAPCPTHQQVLWALPPSRSTHIFPTTRQCIVLLLLGRLQ